jgi:hypothetical protein
MATKAEFLANLSAQVEFLSTVEEIELKPTLATGQDGSTLKAYNAHVIAKRPNGAYQGQNQQFYVLNEGEADETAFVINEERKNHPPSAFKQQLDAYISGQLSDTVMKITLDTVNEEHQFAIATAYILDTQADTVSSKKFFLTKDDQGNPFRKEYVS